MKRTPRNKRVATFERISITPRDKEILLCVYENRFLRRDQIERLFFTTTSACNQRLQKLYQHRFLERIYQPVEFGFSQAVYALDTIGADVVAKTCGRDKGQLNWCRKHNRVESLFLEHTLGVAETRVCLEDAIAGNKNTRFMFWKRETFLPRERVQNPDNPERPLSLIPDAFFGVRTEREDLYFFVEVDMGTESLDRFKNKIIAYREYWKTGQYGQRYSYRNFRVLTITIGPQRLNNLIKIAGDAGAKNMFLFTVDGLLPDILGTIWYRPTSLDPISILD